MKNRFGKLVSIVAAMILIGLLQPALVRADDPCRGIGGTGRTTLDCGIGGTGNSAAGIGGTGHAGIGGTGSKANQAGIGGTGHSDGGIGGTGIVGTITGFGSIWVNGVEVQYDAKTQIESGGSAESTKGLAIGQVVVIEANGSGNELQADKISVVNAVAGRVSAQDSKAGKITVLGQTVGITTRTILQDTKGSQAGMQLNQGDYVKVNGLRLANGEIIATRIERGDANTESSVVGPITNINGNVIEVYGLKIENAAGTGYRVGQEIAVTGTMNGETMSAREVTVSPVARLYERAAHINLEGYAGPVTAGEVKVGGMDVVISGSAVVGKDAAEKLSPGDHIQIVGHFDKDHRVIAERIEFGRDRLERVQLDHIGGHAIESMDRGDHGDHADRVDRVDHADRPDKPDRSYNTDSTNQHSEHSHK